MESFAPQQAAVSSLKLAIVPAWLGAARSPANWYGHCEVHLLMEPDRCWTSPNTNCPNLRAMAS